MIYKHPDQLKAMSEIKAQPVKTTTVFKLDEPYRTTPTPVPQVSDYIRTQPVMKPGLSEDFLALRTEIKKNYDYIKKRGTRHFDYNINIEINNEQTPTNKKNKKQKNEFREYVQAGIDKGADRWYWMGGLKDEFIEVLGPQLGTERFNKFMQLNAGVSPRSTVSKEIDRAFVLYRMKYGKGLPITNMTNDMFPPGMGHLATTTAHRSLINRLENTGLLGNPIDQAKVTSFADNLMGNARPVTVDSHNMKLVTGLSRQPYKTEYGYLESLQQGIAKEFGIDPAAVQSAAWVGGADVTGVADARNITQLFNQKFAKIGRASCRERV